MFKKTRSQVMFVECFGSPCKVIVYNNIGLTRQFFPNIQKIPKIYRYIPPYLKKKDAGPRGCGTCHSHGCHMDLVFLADVLDLGNWNDGRCS